MDALYLILIILGIAAQNVTRKIYSKSSSGGAYTFSALSALVALFFFAISGGSNLHFTWKILPHAIGFAATYSLSIVFTFLSIKEGPLSLTSLVTSYSLLIPTIYGLIAWGESFSLLFAIGLALLIVSIFLIRMEPKAEKNQIEKKRLTPKWLLYVILAFIGSGGCSAVQKGQQLAFNGTYKNEFMIVALGITFVAITICALCFEKKETLTHAKRGLYLYVICGAANGAVNLMVMILSLRMPASVMFPIISAGGILVSAIISMTFYKERLSNLQKVGLLLGVMSIVILNI